MVKTKPIPTWLPRLLQRCTPMEQASILRYRAEVGRMHSKYRNRMMTASACDWEWSRALRGLATADCGSPPFASYVESQHRSQDEWRRRHIAKEAA